MIKHRAAVVTAWLSTFALFGLAGADICRADPAPLVAGSDALLFQVSSDIRLSEFNGATISLKHHTSPAGAWRIGLTASGSTFNQDYDEELNYLDPPLIQLREEERDEVAVSIALERLKYLSPGSQISFYYGLGPALSGSQRTTETRIYVDDSLRTNSTNDNTAFAMGVGAVIGVEWFPHDQIGILGQYGSSVSYRWTSTEGNFLQNGQERTTSTKSHELVFRPDIVRLGISIYW